MLLALWIIPFALAQRTTTKRDGANYLLLFANAATS